MIKNFSDFKHVDPFRRYSRSKWKIVKNRTEFRTIFFALANFRGRAFQKLYARYHPCLTARRPVKFPQDNPTISEVIDSNKLNFRPNFKFSRLHFLGDHAPLGVCASKPW